MDPLSVGASVLAFIGLADRIIRLSKYCIDGLQDAPSDIRMIYGEVSSLRAIVDVLTESEAPSLFDKDGSFEGCRRCLTNLEGLLPADTTSDKAGRRRLTIAELAWPLKQSRARKLLVELSQHKATLLLIISGDIIHELRGIKTGLQQLQIDVSESERRDIHVWLERTNPSRLHNAAISKHEPHTCAWLIRSAEWKSWVSATSPDRMLWIYGIPGAGKTVLASFAIERMKLLCEGTADSSYVYYYCHYSNGQDEAMPLLSWVVSQVCRQLGWAPSQLKRLYGQGCEPTIPELQHVLELALVRLERLFIVVDAVDESMPREGLVRLLAAMTLDSRFQKVHILTTSRQYLDIQRVFSAISTSISMKNSYVDADIERYIRTRLSSAPRLRRWRGSFREIQEVLVAKANGMFRWVDCQLHNIERLGDRTKLLSVLQGLPPDLTETYVRIFDAIPEADRQLVTRVLLWVYGDSRAPWARRGINAKLLLHAVTFDLHGRVPDSKDCIFDWEYLQDLCGCLIAVRNEDSELGVPNIYDAANGAGCYVTLAHYTVWEFLTSSHILSTRASQFAMSTQAVYREFATSILRQALAADPEGRGADWRRDREAYCLILGCALKSAKYLQAPEDLDLFFRFLDPRNPHYRRFRAVQTRALRNTAEQSLLFSVLLIPAEFHVAEDAGERSNLAEILLNARLLNDWMWTEEAPYDEDLPPIGRLSHDEIRELGNHRVAGTFVRLDERWDEEEIKFDGKVSDIRAPDAWALTRWAPV